MLLKYNASVFSTKLAVPYYKSLFDATVIKNGEDNGHSYLKLFSKIPFHLHTNKKIDQTRSYLIIRFEKSELDIFNSVIERVRDLIEVDIKRDKKEMIWGTTLFEFKDKFNLNWVLEIDT